MFIRIKFIVLFIKIIDSYLCGQGENFFIFQVGVNNKWERKKNLKKNN